MRHGHALLHRPGERGDVTLLIDVLFRAGVTQSELSPISRPLARHPQISWRLRWQPA